MSVTCCLYRRRHKQELSVEAGNPHGFDAAKKGQRAAVFCDWLIATFGRYLAPTCNLTTYTQSCSECADLMLHPLLVLQHPDWLS